MQSGIAPLLFGIENSRVHHLGTFLPIGSGSRQGHCYQALCHPKKFLLDNLGLWKEFLHITFTQKAHVAKVGPVARVSPEEDKPGRNRQKLSK